MALCGSAGLGCEQSSHPGESQGRYEEGLGGSAERTEEEIYKYQNEGRGGYFNPELLECEKLIKHERDVQWSIGHDDLQLRALALPRGTRRRPSV